MTQDRPTLILKRLVVLNYMSKIVYDESFHKGVNIIRGENSSGKSTISNFIFYVLGGFFNNWTTEASKVNYVMAEVNINGATITLRREVSASGMTPLSIYYGAYTNSTNDLLNWKTFPYKQTDNTISFSSVLFTALGLPETRSDENTINMHQILRLMYIDQDTPTQNLFRIERFDLPLTRQTISEVLLGIYEDDLYNKRLALKMANKDYETKSREFDHLNKIFSLKTGGNSDLASLQQEIEQTTIDLVGIDEKIIDLKSKVTVNVSKRSVSDLEQVQVELIKEKNLVNAISSAIQEYEVEILDSEQFINTINKRVVELSHSTLTRKILGELPLTHCPHCLSKLDPVDNDHTCLLCKKPLDEEVEKANAKRLQQELEIQVKESDKLLSAKKKKLSELRGQLPVHLDKTRLLQQRLNKLLNFNQTTRDEKIDNLLIEKGNIQNQLEFLNNQIKTVEYLDLLRAELEDLSTRIAVLKLQISNIEKEQTQKLNLAMRKIKDNTMYILRSDLERQVEFKNPQNVDIDFLRDSYSLNDSNNFSASSKTYFKNAVLFAIFFASLELKFFRYPRFIICDNMEDKGMEKVRTQNFQEVIASMSDKYKNIDHQIIFTTSMISDKLNNTSLCVGPEYQQNDKSLKERKKELSPES